VQANDSNNSIATRYGSGVGPLKRSDGRNTLHISARKIGQKTKSYYTQRKAGRTNHNRAQKDVIVKKFGNYNPKYPQNARKHRLSNKQLRHHLRAKGLRNIRFVDRYHGVAKVVAHNKRGSIAKYRVNTRNGHILSARVIRHKKRYR
ncbi:MAG: hypothetical protein ABJN04_01670, partial [Hyphomicrobiales bacterium]